MFYLIQAQNINTLQHSSLRVAYIKLVVFVLALFKVQMECFLLLNLKEEQKSGRLPFTVS